MTWPVDLVMLYAYMIFFLGEEVISLVSGDVLATLFGQ